VTTSTNGNFDRKPFIAGNWKMNMDHVQGITLLQKLAWTLSDAKHDYSRAEVAVFPPFTDLRGVQTLVQGDELEVAYGGQDLSQFDSGAYTGDISGQFLSKLGCKYVLVGHSERRTIHNESDDVLNAKVKAAFRTRSLRYSASAKAWRSARPAPTWSTPWPSSAPVLRDSLLSKLPNSLWPTNPSGPSAPAKLQARRRTGNVCRHPRRACRTLRRQSVASKTRLLYGGSVKANNAAAILKERDVDGLLVGGASLDPAEFANIVRFESHLVTD
jgi:triosephosphate isomerase